MAIEKEKNDPKLSLLGLSNTLGFVKENIVEKHNKV
jgi:hypothetical protein